MSPKKKNGGGGFPNNKGGKLFHVISARQKAETTLKKSASSEGGVKSQEKLGGEGHLLGVPSKQQSDSGKMSIPIEERRRDQRGLTSGGHNRRWPEVDHGREKKDQGCMRGGVDQGGIKGESNGTATACDEKVSAKQEKAPNKKRHKRKGNGAGVGKRLLDEKGKRRASLKKPPTRTIVQKTDKGRKKRRYDLCRDDGERVCIKEIEHMAKNEDEERHQNDQKARRRGWGEPEEEYARIKKTSLLKHQ